MPLDFNQVGQQIKQMGGDLRQTANHHDQLVAHAWAKLEEQSPRWEHWARHAEDNYLRSPWLLAAPAEPIINRYQLPKFPPNYCLAAVDGSQIDLDRHWAVECYLINLGLVTIQYGQQPYSKLHSVPALHYNDQELLLRDKDGRSYKMAGALVHAERDTREGIALARLAQEILEQSTTPLVAMQDGTLIRWSLSGLDPWVRAHFLQRYLDEGLAALRAADVPTCSYISHPKAPEVTGIARLIVNPTLNNTSKAEGLVDPYPGINDTKLFGNGWLGDGERSALFKSLSKINVEEYRDHAIYFFYLNVGAELARIEMPEWVAQRPEWVDLIHAVAYDQAHRGGGYPVALARAHEQAVVRESDRRVFRQMIEQALWHARLNNGSSLKQDAKAQVRV
ncbi:MAG: DNA double-strand break repair nuclease NurA [Chloroflexi bacterium]|nr:DNA double-strand break repair nuclease NurA [Chloroflexota bacterium]